MQEIQRSRACLRKLNMYIDMLLISLVALNIWLYFWCSSVNPQNLTNLSRHYVKRKYEESVPANCRNETIKEQYTEEQLIEAIEGLHLPTWSRSYVNCTSPKSEVTCDQIVHAWRVLSGWAESQKRPFSEQKHFFMRHLYDGVGNRFSTDTATFIVALMNNRTYTVSGIFPAGDKGNGIGQAFDFHPAVSTVGTGKTPDIDAYFHKNVEESYHLYTFETWLTYDYKKIFQMYTDLQVDMLLYATMPYVNPDLASYCYTHFGRHMVYFVCNFLMRIPESAMSVARRVIDTVPTSVKVFGVHLRYHIPGEYFAYSVERTFDSIMSFLLSVSTDRPTMFALATDSPLVESKFMKNFGKITIKTQAVRRADADHHSALFDIAMLEMCDECLLTYRSTFSYITMARMGKRAWFVDKETPDVFQVSFSQATPISMLYHQFDPNDWQPNRRLHVTPKLEKTMRAYFKNFML